MMVRWFNRMMLAVLLAACGSTGGGGPGDDSDDDVAPADAARDGAVAADAGVDAYPPWIDPPPICATACSTPADCAIGGPGSAFDADNYACEDGACHWRGCNSASECTMLQGDPNMVCERAFGSPNPECWEACTTEADCPHRANNPSADADNYVCDDGKCRYTGCNSTEECRATSPAFALCGVRGDYTLANCFLGCTVAADCGSPTDPANDADNYVCDDGACVYTGCNSTAECSGTRVCVPW